MDPSSFPHRPYRTTVSALARLPPHEEHSEFVPLLEWRYARYERFACGCTHNRSIHSTLGYGHETLEHTQLHEGMSFLWFLGTLVFVSKFPHGNFISCRLSPAPRMPYCPSCNHGVCHVNTAVRSTAGNGVHVMVLFPDTRLRMPGLGFEAFYAPNSRMQILAFLFLVFSLLVFSILLPHSTRDYLHLVRADSVLSP